MNEQGLDYTLDLSAAESVLAGPNTYGYPDETFMLAEKIVAGIASKEDRDTFWMFVWNAQEDYFISNPIEEN